jgi:hypothetical protein
MTPNEIITAGISGLALVVAGFALIYSRRSAAAAQKSADAAQHANELLARQLELAASELDRQIQKEQKESHPFLRWSNPIKNKNETTWDYENFGGEVKNLKVESTNNVPVSINPIQILPNKAKGRIFFGKRWDQFPLPFTFTISGETKLGEQVSQQFKISNESSEGKKVVSLRRVENFSTAHTAGL